MSECVISNFKLFLLLQCPNKIQSHLKQANTSENVLSEWDTFPLIAQYIITAYPVCANWDNLGRETHTLASVPASHPCWAKNSSLCSQLISRCRPSLAFCEEGGARKTNTTSKQPKQESAAAHRWWKHLLKMHVYAYLFVCACSEIVCSWELQCQIWCYCLCIPVCLLNKKSIICRSSRAKQYMSPWQPQTSGQFLAGWVAISPVINGGSSTEMNAYVGYIYLRELEGLCNIVWGRVLSN